MALDGLYLGFNMLPMVDHSMGVVIGKQCMAQTAASPFRCCAACSPQPVGPTYPKASAAFLMCHSKANWKVVTSSKVLLPSYVRRLDDLREKPRLPDGPGFGLEDPRIRNTL